MTTAILLGLMLVFEPKEHQIMSRPPRDPKMPILTGLLQFRILLVALVLLVGCFSLFHWEQQCGASVAEARTVAVNLFVMVELFYLFNCRSFTRSAFAIGFFSNPWVIFGSLAMIALQLAFTYLPAMNALFHSAPISLDAWWRILGFATFAYLLVGAEKQITNRMKKPDPLKGD